MYANEKPYSILEIWAIVIYYQTRQDVKIIFSFKYKVTFYLSFDLYIFKNFSIIFEVIKIKYTKYLRKNNIFMIFKFINMAYLKFR